MKKLFLASLLTTLSFTSSANWEAGIGYLNLSDDVFDKSISYGAIVGTARYNFNLENDFHWLAGIRLGTGIQDDEITIHTFNGRFTFDTKLDHFFSIDVRGQYELNDKAFIFFEPSYANVKLSIEDESDDEWEFGGGVGVGYRFTDTVSAEFAYEIFDGTNVFGLSVVGKF